MSRESSETIATEMVHKMCDSSELAIRAILVDLATKADIQDLIHEMALVKYYTWATAVQGPNWCQGYMELDWDEFDHFEDVLQSKNLAELIVELTFLMPKYLKYLTHWREGVGKPAKLEAWDNLAMEE